jgi:ABC-type dipeptide/oligopeptide/nickel transport system permease component
MTRAILLHHALNAAHLPLNTAQAPDYVFLHLGRIAVHRVFHL